MLNNNIFKYKHKHKYNLITHIKIIYEYLYFL